MKTFKILNQVWALLFLPILASTTLAQQSSTKLDSATEARIARLEKHAALNKPGLSQLVVVGLTTFGYVSNRQVSTTGGISTTTKNGVFGGDTYEFSPMFLWRQGKKVLLEFEPSFSPDGVGVNWAAISYFASRNLILRGGYFVLPFGIYSKKLAAGWINKVATDPIGMDLFAGTDFGFGASGGVQWGVMKWNYDVAVSNGLTLMPDGTLQNSNMATAARGRTYTGRFGLLPFSNNSLEIGVSGLTGDVNNGQLNGSGQPLYPGARATFYAFDLNYVKNLSPIQINIKGQYNNANVTTMTFTNTADPNNSTYSFTNHTTSWYAQGSFRPIESQSQFIKNLEPAFRYGQYNTPSSSAWGANTTQIDLGLNYWITWRTVIRLTYEILDGKNTSNPVLFPSGGAPADDVKNYAFHIQFSIQL